MRSRIVGFTLACVALAGLTVVAQTDEADRVKKAATVFDEVMGAPDKAIPKSILDKAEAIAVIPGTIKAGLGIGGHGGKGILSARNRQDGTWSNPGFLTLAGGSFGAQIGAQELDLVLVVMNKAGLDNLLKNEFKIGAEASVAAGPVGRAAEASTDVQLRAEILSYSRARGLFAGASLSGSVIKEDGDANQRFYGRAVRNRDLVTAAPAAVGTAGADSTAAVAGWHQTLTRYTK
jgi:lipid-binding SYLF domain-containing protein